MSMLHGIDTDKATLIASQKELNGLGYRHSLYRSEDGRLYLYGVSEGLEKKPVSLRRASKMFLEVKEDYARKWLVWNGHAELVEKVFGKKPGGSISGTILKSGGDPGGASPDPGKVQETLSGESPLVQDAKRRMGTGGSALSKDAESPLVRNAIRRNKAEGSSPDPDEEEKKPDETAPDEDEKKPEENDEEPEDQDGKESEKDDEGAPAGEEEKTEEPEESALVRNAKRRRERML